MGPTVVLRSGASRALGVAMVVLAVAGLLSTAASGTGATLRYAAPQVLLALVGWAAFWRPAVEVSDGGVLVTNTLRTVQVPWPALREVEGRYGLRLVTAYGAVSAWAATAPSGRGRAREQDSEAAVLVRERWERLQAAGHLDGARLERADLAVAWHLGTAVGLLAALVGTVVLPLT